jgi:hypothetical protein
VRREREVEIEREREWRGIRKQGTRHAPAGPHFNQRAILEIVDCAGHDSVRCRVCRREKKRELFYPGVACFYEHNQQ